MQIVIAMDIPFVDVNGCWRRAAKSASMHPHTHTRRLIAGEWRRPIRRIEWQRLWLTVTHESALYQTITGCYRDGSVVGEKCF